MRPVKNMIMLLAALLVGVSYPPIAYADSPESLGTGYEQADIMAVDSPAEHTVFVSTNLGPVRSFTVRDTEQVYSTYVPIPEGYEMNGIDLTYSGEDYGTLKRYPGYLQKTDTYITPKLFWEDDLAVGGTSNFPNSDVSLFVALSPKTQSNPNQGETQEDDSGGCSMSGHRALRSGGELLAIPITVFLLSRLAGQKSTC